MPDIVPKEVPGQSNSSQRRRLRPFAYTEDAPFLVAFDAEARREVQALLREREVK